MILGVVGSKNINESSQDQVLEIARAVFTDYPEIDKLVHGNGIGVERMIARYAQQIKRITSETVPLRSFQWSTPGGFKDMNTTIVKKCDMLLVVISIDDESGGPAWTAKHARRERVPVIEYQLATPVSEEPTDDEDTAAFDVGSEFADYAAEEEKASEDDSAA